MSASMLKHRQLIKALLTAGGNLAEALRILRTQQGILDTSIDLLDQNLLSKYRAADITA
jgi:hypothetical protein